MTCHHTINMTHGWLVIMLVKRNITIVFGWRENLGGTQRVSHPIGLITPKVNEHLDGAIMGKQLWFVNQKLPKCNILETYSLVGSSFHRPPFAIQSSSVSIKLDKHLHQWRYHVLLSYEWIISIHYLSILDHTKPPFPVAFFAGTSHITCSHMWNISLRNNMIRTLRTPGSTLGFFGIRTGCHKTTQWPDGEASVFAGCCDWCPSCFNPRFFWSSSRNFKFGMFPFSDTPIWYCSLIHVCVLHV